MAVSGVRRSWEIERSSVVFTTLLRRRAFVSTTWVSSSSRFAAAPIRASSEGTTRS